MRNIRNSVEDHRGREGKLNEKKSGTATNHERLWTPGNKLRVSERRGVGGWASPLMGIKEGSHIAWGTGCYMQTRNHGTLHQKIMKYCVVTNIS